MSEVSQVDTLDSEEQNKVTWDLTNEIKKTLQDWPEYQNAQKRASAKLGELAAYAFTHKGRGYYVSETRGSNDTLRHIFIGKIRKLTDEQIDPDSKLLNAEEVQWKARGNLLYYDTQIRVSTGVSPSFSFMDDEHFQEVTDRLPPNSTVSPAHYRSAHGPQPAGPNGVRATRYMPISNSIEAASAIKDFLMG